MMKKIFSLLALICLVLPHVAADGETIIDEDGYYRALLVITSKSDWSTVRLISGGHFISATYEVTKGKDAPECKCWYDAHLNLIGMVKKQFDTALVRIEVKIIVYLEEGSTLIFEIKKGDIEYTTVEIFNYNGEEPTSAETFTHECTISDDPENRVEFSMNADELTAGGPLSLLYNSVPQLVWAFYYPWYYENQWYSSDVLTDMPLIPHSSSDPKIIELHIKQAMAAGIDGFIVSWWGEDSYTDHNLKTILDIASKHDFKITIYFESLGDGPRSEEELKRMFLSFFRNYGNDDRYYRIEGKPVIFVWAVDSHPPSVWTSILSPVEFRGYTGIYIAMTPRVDYLDIFDGLHIYGTVGFDNLPIRCERLSLVCRTYGHLHDRKKYIWAATLCPGYDDRKIPGRAGLYHSRDNGEYYEKTFDAAFESSPDWILITSFNEWWEHTHIEPSVNYGYTYLDMTALFSSEFKGIQLIPEIVIQKTVDKSHIDIDESVIITITIMNSGNGSALNVSIAENISKFELLESIIPQKIDRMLPSDVVNYQMTLRAKGDGSIEIPETTVRFEDVYGEEHEVTSESIEVTVLRPQVASTYICVILIVIAVILIMAVFLKKSEER